MVAVPLPFLVYEYASRRYKPETPDRYFVHNPRPDVRDYQTPTPPTALAIDIDKPK